MARSQLRVQLRDSTTTTIYRYFLNVFADFWWEVGKAFWLFDSFAVDIASFEVIADIGLMEVPQRLLDPPALLFNKIFLLPGKPGDAILYFRPPLKPTGIM